jgi:tetraprenyl-beta-curcumene synthase
MVNALLTTTASLGLLTKFIGHVFPIVSRELDGWSNYAANHGCNELCEQALASIRDKKFHCQGGSIYSLYHGVHLPDFVRLVVALQTISDYLDNLCDRAGITDEQAFRQLHLAISDALDPDTLLHDYYQHYPFKDDGGYLASLVRTCQQEVAKLPSYPQVKDETRRLAQLYSQLQTYKHLDPSIRETKMTSWIADHIKAYPEISTWEFAAATGSTLGMFMLCAAASNPELTKQDALAISSAYFPWISGLHILLDYFIDGAEDRESGDLNFVAYYVNEQETLSRLVHFKEQAVHQAQALPNPQFTETVIQGLLAMYLSDPKTNTPQERAIKTALLKSSGKHTTFMYALCKLLRLKRAL